MLGIKEIDSDKKSLVKNVLSLGFLQIANYVLPLISMPIITRIIGPEKFGVINFSAALVTYFSLVISYGFDLTATRRIANDPLNQQKRNAVFNEVFTTQCLLFIGSTIFYSIILFSIPELKAEKEVAIFSFLICLSTLLTPNWLFQAMQDISKVALMSLISKLSFTVAVLIVIKREEDYTWQPLLFGAIQTIVAFISFLWAIKKYKIKFNWTPLKSCFQLLKKERTIFFSLVVVNLYTTTNTVFLGFYQSAEQVGYYTAGQRLILIAQSVLTIPLAQSLYPFIGKAFSESQYKGLKVAQKVIPLLMIFTGLSSIAMYIIGPYILSLFYGEQFEAAIPVFKILVIIPLISAVSNVFGVQIMLNQKMDNAFFRITSCGAILSIIMNMLMIRHWGYIGTAINWLITELFILISMYVVLRRSGINPLDFVYFKTSALIAYIEPLKRKLLTRIS